MKHIFFKSKYSIAIYTLHWCLFAIGLMLIGNTHLYAKGHEKFKVALLLPASITDGGWNAFAYDGLKAIEKELGAKISHVESRTPTDQEAHFRDYALDGYHLIFGHGFEYQDPAKQVAPDFPETVFITSTGNTITDNISPIVFAIEEPVYLLGIIAGSMTQTNKIGIVGGQNIAAINSMFSAFEESAKSVNPDVVVRRAYVGNWSDIGKGKELARAHINEDSDFLFPVADVAGLGVFQAAMEAQSDGKTVYTFGVYQDQSELSPKTIVASAIVTPKVFVNLAKVVMKGSFEPQPYRFTMAEDEALTFVYNPVLKDKVADTVQKAVAEAKAKIIAGELKVSQTYLTEEHK
ncbi:BMP family ABC transporter substrate-binding protein [Candidatus Poribacteria bacterium]|nr:MAG: BMP family ABC transporter substrate-binding protein [Candidatus Poribacteria bacterium]